MTAERSPTAAVQKTMGPEQNLISQAHRSMLAVPRITFKSGVARPAAKLSTSLTPGNPVSLTPHNPAFDPVDKKEKALTLLKLLTLLSRITHARGGCSANIGIMRWNRARLLGANAHRFLITQVSKTLEIRGIISQILTLDKSSSGDPFLRMQDAKQRRDGQQTICLCSL